MGLSFLRGWLRLVLFTSADGGRRNSAAQPKACLPPAGMFACSAVHACMLPSPDAQKTRPPWFSHINHVPPTQKFKIPDSSHPTAPRPDSIVIISYQYLIA